MTDNRSTPRFFKVVFPGDIETGRYTGTTPKQAASKAFTKYMQRQRMQGEDVNNTVTMSLKETTRGCDHNTYEYECKRTRLAEPMEIQITGEAGEQRTVRYEYRNEVKNVFHHPANANNDNAQEQVVREFNDLKIDDDELSDNDDDIEV
jgi:hypothetical protein